MPNGQFVIPMNPPVSNAELEALQIIAQRPVWRVGFADDRIGVWEVERLEDRGWVRPQQLGCQDERARLMEVGWPQILRSFERAAKHGDELLAQLRVTTSGHEASQSIDFNQLPVIGPLGQVAEMLERISAEWRWGDLALIEQTEAGLSGTQGFEGMVGRFGRLPVRELVSAVRERRIPRLVAQGLLDPGLRDRLGVLLRALDPDDMAEDSAGEPLDRWRLTWPALRAQTRSCRQPRVRRVARSAEAHAAHRAAAAYLDREGI